MSMSHEEIPASECV